MEGDAVYLADPVAIEEFQSTPSVWRETAQSIAINSDYKISIHSLRMEGDADAEAEARGEGILIHSLRMEGDIFRNKNRTRTAYFNPLPPYGGRQHYAALVLVSADIFNPLPPYGGRPSVTHSDGHISVFQFTPLRMEGDVWLSENGNSITGFQSTPSVWRGDVVTRRRLGNGWKFQSTPSVWRRHQHMGYKGLHWYFNPLPSVWRRQCRFSAVRSIRYFNPLPPYGGRLFPAFIASSASPFQSTPSVWRETTVRIE